MGTNSQLKKRNVLQVLQFLKIGSANITKPEIAVSTGLTTTTVQTIITDLERRGIINSQGVSASSGGRKAQYYGINGKYRYLVGVYMRINKITVGVFDYTINLLNNVSRQIMLEEQSVEEIIQLIVDMISMLLNEHNIPLNKVVGVGISVPGPVDYENGCVLAIRGYPKWKNIAIKNNIINALGIPVFVDKDVNSALLLLNWAQLPSSKRNMLYISVEDGIGGAVIFNGQLHRGNHGFICEIGHITVRENGKRCACGNYGCLETISSDFAIIDRARNELSIPSDRNITIDNLIEMSKEGNEQVDRFFVDAASWLAVTIRNSFALYDPDEIVINCRWLLQKKDIYFKLLDSLYDDNNLIDRRNISVRMVDMQEFGLRSAAAIVATNEMESLNSSVFQRKEN